MRRAQILLLFWMACSSPPTAVPDSGLPDAVVDAYVRPCASPMECGTGADCEMADCRPGDPGTDARGCIVTPLCAANERCSAGRCVRDCTPQEADRDNDGDPNPECGGNDCDDDDNQRSSRRLERCDAAGVDEDCNPGTIRDPTDPSDGDPDFDSIVSYACVQNLADGSVRRGTDCDDANPGSGLGTLRYCTSCEETCQLECTATGCDDAVAITAGGAHACVLRRSGAVACWGRGDSGQLGAGLLVDALVPQATDISDAIGVFAGVGHTCVLRGGTLLMGGMYCFGDNDDGQLGDGTREDRSRAVRVFGVSEVGTLVALGASHTCIAGGPRAACWGGNSEGELGTGDFVAHLEPTTVTGLPSGVPIVDIDAGEQHSCAVTEDGRLYCWGSNACGQLAQGSFLGRSSTARQVTGLGAVIVDVEIGGHTTCAVASDGRAWCWGISSYGLGAAAPFTTERCTSGDFTRTPQMVGLAGIARLESTVGPRFCARAEEGRTWCWGWNSALSEVIITPPSSFTRCDRGESCTSPIQVARADGVDRLALGGEFACTLGDDLVRCWGLGNYGQLAQGTRDGSREPVPLLPLP